jgi:drug/metabolite transporter (DMT)-like permease
MTTTNAGAALEPAPTPGFIVSRLLICSILWASSYLFIKVSSDLNPFVLAAARGLVGALSLAAWFMVLGKSILPKRHEWRIWAILGTFNGWLPNVLLAYALTQITTASAAMIQASAPLLVALLSHVLFAEERLSAQRLIGVLVGFIGMGILIGPAAFPESGVSPMGVIAVLATSLSYAAANVYVRTVREVEPARLALGQQVCSGSVASVLALGLAGPAAFAQVPSHIGPLLALGALATALPILLFMNLIRRTGPTRASMVGYLMPIWAAILAVLFLGEHIGGREILGGAVVLVGVALVSFTGRLKTAKG